jgi:hypothetical protein
MISKAKWLELRKAANLLVVIGAVVFLHGGLSESHHAQRLYSSVALADEQQIRLALEEITQAVRDGSPGRLLAQLLPPGSTVADNQTGQQLRNSLESAFIKARKQESGKLLLFGFDSVRISLKGADANVVCSILPDDSSSSRKSTTLRFHKTGMGQWKFIADEQSLKLILHYVQDHGIISHETVSTTGASPRSKRVSSPRATQSTTPYTSQHALIPKRCVDVPTLWAVRRTEAVQHTDRELFYEVTDMDYVPIDASNGVAFVLDQTWARIVYAESQGNWIASYGDEIGQYSFSEPRGLKALKFPDGTYHILVADAGRREVAEFTYNLSNKTIQYLASRTNGLSRPLDVDICPTDVALNPTSYTIWVADENLGAILALDPNGNVIRTIDSYSYNGQNYSHDHLVKIVSRVVGGNGNIGIIDQTVNSLVVLNVLGPAPPTTISMSTFVPPSQLTSIAYTAGGEYLVADAGLQRLHAFSSTGTYLTSFNEYNADHASNPSVFSAVSGIPLCNDNLNLICSVGDNNPDYSISDIAIANGWADESGFGRFLPGVDIIHFAPTPLSNGILFDYDITNFSQLSSEILDQNNAVVHEFLPSNQLVLAGHRSDGILYSQLGNGTFTLKITALPGGNSAYGEYQQNPIVVTYSFVSATTPPPPVLASPSNGAINVSSSPTLSWNSSAGATSYGLQVSTSSSFSTVIVNQTAIAPTSFGVGGLANNTTYYWHVNATGTGGTSAWSSTSSFTTESPPQQYYLTVSSSWGTTTGQGWYNAGSTAYAGLTENTAPYQTGIRFEFTYWSGDASGSDYAQSNPITMNGSKTAHASWRTEVELSVDCSSGGHVEGTPRGWYPDNTYVGGWHAVPDNGYYTVGWQYYPPVYLYLPLSLYTSFAPIPLNPPAGLSYSYCGYITLYWGAPSPAPNLYNVYRRKTCGGSWECIGNTSGTSWGDYPTWEGCEWYEYGVSAVYSTGESSMVTTLIQLI